MPARFQNKGWANPVAAPKKTWLQNTADEVGQANKILQGAGNTYLAYKSAQNAWDKSKAKDTDAVQTAQEQPINAALSPDTQSFEDMIISGVPERLPTIEGAELEVFAAADDSNFTTDDVYAGRDAAAVEAEQAFAEHLAQVQADQAAAMAANQASQSAMQQAALMVG